MKNLLPLKRPKRENYDNHAIQETLTLVDDYDREHIQVEDDRPRSQDEKAAKGFAFPALAGHEASETQKSDLFNHELIYGNEDGADDDSEKRRERR